MGKTGTSGAIRHEPASARMFSLFAVALTESSELGPEKCSFFHFIKAVKIPLNQQPAAESAATII